MLCETVLCTVHRIPARLLIKRNKKIREKKKKPKPTTNINTFK